MHLYMYSICYNVVCLIAVVMSRLGSFLSDRKKHETALTEPRAVSIVHHLFFSAFNPNIRVTPHLSSLVKWYLSLMPTHPFIKLRC